MDKKQERSATNLLTRVKNSEILALVIALVLLCAIISLLTPTFLTERNIMNVLRQVSLSAICGFGLTMVILLGEIDLSVGSQQGIAGITSVAVLNATGSIPLAILAALASGALIGALNGVLVTKGNMNSLIVTLGTMAIWRGVIMVSTGAVSIQANDTRFQEIGTGFTGPVPNAVILAAIVFAAIYYVLNYSTFGRYIFAVGGNKEASLMCGLPVHKMKISVYVISGILTMLSGVLLASRMSSGQPTAGTGFEMIVIASIILGGVSLSGGIGSIGGALVGMLILGVLQNGLTLLNVSSFWQDISRGVVIIVAVYIDGIRKSSVAKRAVQEQKEKWKGDGAPA